MMLIGWLVGWFYGMLTFVGLFTAEVIFFASYWFQVINDNNQL